MKLLKFKLVLTFAALFAATAQAGSTQYCRSLLSTQQISSIQKDVRDAIAARTAPLLAGAPEIINADGTRINVLEAINRELAKPILDSSKRIVLNYIDELAKIWASANRENIILKANQARALDPRAFAKLSNELDADGLPKTDFVQNNRAAALMVRAGRTDKMGIADFEQQVAQKAIEMLKSKYLALLREKSDAKIEEAEELLVSTLNQSSPDWNAIIKESSSLIESFKHELKTHFDIQASLADGMKNSIAAHATIERALTQTVTAEMKNGIPEITMPEIGVRAYYDIELGTVVLESSKKAEILDRSIVLIADHGEGTLKSNASSWKYILPKFVDASLNPIAMNLPMAGVGMRIQGLYPTTAYIDYRYHLLRQRFTPQVGHPTAPIVLAGRSMGASKGYAHALLHDDANNVVDAYVLSSFSNPQTIALQSENIKKQVDLGQIQGIVPESLKNADDLSAELMQELSRMKSINPNAFLDFGDHLLFLQGNADDDGGPTVVNDLEKFTNEFAPRAHVYLFENILLKYKIPHYEKVNPEKWEATHFLFTNQANWSRDSIKKTLEHLNTIPADQIDQSQLEMKEAYQAIYDQVPAEDIPALHDQHIEAVGAMYGFFDYLMSSPSTRPEITRAAKVFAEYRDHLTGGKSYLEYYANRYKISAQDLAQATPGRGSRVARLKRIQEFWKAEAAKH